MKKLFVVGLLILSFSMFLSCGTQKREDITIWAWNRNVFIMEAAIERYRQEVDSTFTATVEPFSQNDIDVKFKAASQLGKADSLADIILGDAMRMRGYYYLWPTLFYDFSQRVEAADNLNLFVPSTIDVVTIGDKLIAMPYGIAPTYVFAYTPLWDPEDISTILAEGWTWGDYLDFGLKIQSENPNLDVYMTAYNMRLDDRLYRTMTSQRGEWFMDADHEVEVANANSVQALTWVQSFFDAGIVGHVDSGDFRSLMIEGRIAAQIQGFFLTGQLKDIGQDTAGDWLLLPLPSWDIEESSASITGGSYLYVNNYSSNANRAADFAIWYTTHVEAVVEGLHIGGIFPANMGAYTTEYFATNDPFFSNQAYLSDVAQNVHQALAIFPSRYNAFNYDAFI
ncbi:MAG: extracellular solute-binding protein, partial [Acholeplasmatales bacterium]